MCYNFRKLTFYGLTRPQSIRKWKQMSGQTILSSPQDLEFNPNFAKNQCCIPVVKYTARHASGVNDRYTLFNADHMPNSSIQSILASMFQYTNLIYTSHFVWTQYIAQNCPTGRRFWKTPARRRRPSPTKTDFKQVVGGVFY